MNHEKLLKVVRNAHDGHLQGDDESWIREQIRRHPYFSMLHLANARRASHMQDPDTDRLDKLAALYAASREGAMGYLGKPVGGGLPNSYTESDVVKLAIENAGAAAPSIVASVEAKQAEEATNQQLAHTPIQAAETTTNSQVSSNISLEKPPAKEAEEFVVERPTQPLAEQRVETPLVPESKPTLANIPAPESATFGAGLAPVKSAPNPDRATPAAKPGTSPTVFKINWKLQTLVQIRTAMYLTTAGRIRHELEEYKSQFGPTTLALLADSAASEPSTPALAQWASESKLPQPIVEVLEPQHHVVVEATPETPASTPEPTAPEPIAPTTPQAETPETSPPVLATQTESFKRFVSPVFGDKPEMTPVGTLYEPHLDAKSLPDSSESTPATQDAPAPQAPLPRSTASMRRFIQPEFGTRPTMTPVGTLYDPTQDTAPPALAETPATESEAPETNRFTPVATEQAAGSEPLADTRTPSDAFLEPVATPLETTASTQPEASAEHTLAVSSEADEPVDGANETELSLSTGVEAVSVNMSVQESPAESSVPGVEAITSPSMQRFVMPDFLAAAHSQSPASPPETPATIQQPSNPDNNNTLEDPIGLGAEPIAHKPELPATHVGISSPSMKRFIMPDFLATPQPRTTEVAGRLAEELPAETQDAQLPEHTHLPEVSAPAEPSILVTNAQSAEQPNKQVPLEGDVAHHGGITSPSMKRFVMPDFLGTPQPRTQNEAPKPKADETPAVPSAELAEPPVTEMVVEASSLTPVEPTVEVNTAANEPITSPSMKRFVMPDFAAQPTVTQNLGTVAEAPVASTIEGTTETEDNISPESLVSEAQGFATDTGVPPREEAPSREGITTPSMKRFVMPDFLGTPQPRTQNALSVSNEPTKTHSPEQKTTPATEVAMGSPEPLVVANAGSEPITPQVVDEATLNNEPSLHQAEPAEPVPGREAITSPSMKRFVMPDFLPTPQTRTQTDPATTPATPAAQPNVPHVNLASQQEMESPLAESPVAPVVSAPSEKPVEEVALQPPTPQVGITSPSMKRFVMPDFTSTPQPPANLGFEAEVADDTPIAPQPFAPEESTSRESLTSPSMKRFVMPEFGPSATPQSLPNPLPVEPSKPESGTGIPNEESFLSDETTAPTTKRVVSPEFSSPVVAEADAQKNTTPPIAGTPNNVAPEHPALAGEKPVPVSTPSMQRFVMPEFAQAPDVPAVRTTYKADERPAEEDLKREKSPQPRVEAEYQSQKPNIEDRSELSSASMRRFVQPVFGDRPIRSLEDILKQRTVSKPTPPVQLPTDAEEDAKGKRRPATFVPLRFTNEPTVKPTEQRTPITETLAKIEPERRVEPKQVEPTPHIQVPTINESERSETAANESTVEKNVTQEVDTTARIKAEADVITGPLKFTQVESHAPSNPETTPEPADDQVLDQMLESAYHQELVRTPAQFEPIAETAYAPPSDAIDPAFVPSTVVEVSSGQDFLLGDQNLDSKINSFRENLRKIKARNIQNPAEITLMAIQNRFLNSILNQTEPRPVTIGGQPKPTSSSPDAIEGFAPGGNPNSIDLLIQKYGELQPNFANRAKETADQPESRFEEFGIDDLESAQAEPKFELVSENLAKIHARQGNTAKALQIYQQLKLKYPEKSSYFEAQIQTLRA